MSEQKLSERMSAEIKELILQGLPVTQSQALDWRDEVAALEAENAELLVKLDEAIAWHEGDDSPRARLEAKLEAMKQERSILWRHLTRNRTLFDDAKTQVKALAAAQELK